MTTYIPVNESQHEKEETDTIYLHSNGIHLDIALHKNSLDWNKFKGLNTHNNDSIFSFGWGDENFYINTPEWSDLSLTTAFTAVFIKSPTLVHVTNYSFVQNDWKKVAVSQNQLTQINKLLSATFQKDELGNVQILSGKGYTNYDEFYRANGNYHLFNTCNSWVNFIFNKSGLKACWWTPFDFGLLRMYKN